MIRSKRVNLPGIAGALVLALGVAALLASIIYESSILAFIGLGLAFWGALFLYVKDQGYVSKPVLDASVLPSLSTIGQMIKELGFKGTAVYLPPKYFEDPEATMIYIPKQKYAALPTPEQIGKYEGQLTVENPQGLLLTPPGAELTRLFEKTLETSFNKVDLQYLQKNAPKLFIEDLEIAENLELHTEKDAVHIKITNSICRRIHNEARRLSPLLGKIGCPVCSAIACALTKATGNPIIIEKTQISEDGKTIETTYQILKTTEPLESIDRSISSIEPVHRE